MEQKVSKDDKIIKYKLDTQLDTLNIVLPFFSLQIPSQRHSSELGYKLPDDKDFDFKQILQNLDLLQFSKSAAVGKGIKIHTDFADAGAVFDFSSRGDVSQSKLGYLDFVADFKLNNISFIGDFIDAAKQPKSVEMEYRFSDLNTQSATRLAEIQQKIQQNDTADLENIDDKEMASLLDNLVDKAKMIFEIRINFAKADMHGKFDFSRKNGYLFGTGTLSVNNLYNLFPEQKQCFNNPQAESIPACSDDNFAILSGFAEYIDISQNNSESIFTFNEQGIFKNNEKIGEPIELNFEKMLREEEEETEQKTDIENEAFEQTETETEVEAVTETETEAE